MDRIFDVFGIDWRILFVQVVNFGVLLGALWYFLYGPLTRLIESRRAQIIQGVADAERAATALREADAKKVEIVTNASIEAERVLAAAREAGKVREIALVAEAEEKCERMLKEADLKSEELKRTALLESREEMARLIVLGVEKTLRADAV